MENKVKFAFWTVVQIFIGRQYFGSFKFYMAQ